MTASFARALAWVALAALVVCPVVAQTPTVPPFDRAAPPGDPPPVPSAGDASQPEILGRGPIHQGFAQPVEPKPRPGPVVRKAPPKPIEEIPPEQRPDGDNVQWIPGYWSWDEDRSDYIWVSGIWRIPPAGRKWVPGYWAAGDDGYRWVSGFWGEAGQPAVPYLDPPPDSLDRGPSFPAIDEGSSWVPGIWVSRDDRWLWRPGYWCAPRPGFVYTPPCYSWTPRGCVYVGGFWDRCLATRGLCFAPAAFSPGWFGGGFRYQPNYVLNPGGFLNSFWARPGCGYYAFGDFYGANYGRLGYQPWNAWGPRARDPLFGYYQNVNARANPNWSRSLASTFEGRSNGTLAAPPRTVARTNRPVPAGNLVQPLASYNSPNLALTRTAPTDRLRTDRGVADFQAVTRQRSQLEARPVTPETRRDAMLLNRPPLERSTTVRPDVVTRSSPSLNREPRPSLERNTTVRPDVVTRSTPSNLDRIPTPERATPVRPEVITRSSPSTPDRSPRATTMPTRPTVPNAVTRSSPAVRPTAPAVRPTTPRVATPAPRITSPTPRSTPMPRYSAPAATPRFSAPAMRGGGAMGGGFRGGAGGGRR